MKNGSMTLFLLKYLGVISLLLLQQQQQHTSSAFLLGKVKRRQKQPTTKTSTEKSPANNNKSGSISTKKSRQASPTTIVEEETTTVLITENDDESSPPDIQLRLARVSDVASLQRCNRACLPENYQDQYFLDHLRYSPKLIMVAERIFPDNVGKAPEVIAYVLGRVEERPYRHRRPPPYFDELQCAALDKYHAGIGRCPMEKFGHVASLAVMEQYQRRGLAYSLLKQFHYNLETCYEQVATSGLHVRVSNRAATKLYEKLGYVVDTRMKQYYTDREDAYFMKKLMPVAIEAVGFEATTATTNAGIMNQQQQQNEEFHLPRRLIQPEDKTQQVTIAAQPSATAIELVTSSLNPQGIMDANIIRNQPSVKVVSGHR